MTYSEHLLLIGFFMVAAWSLFTYLWPRLLMIVYKRAILVKGFGEGPIPVNSLYTEQQEIFADPLRERDGGSNLATTGVNRDTLMTMGWLDLSLGAQVLHVPEMDDRYYSVQFTDPLTNTNFAYVGKRTTGTHAGNYLITGPGWKGQVSAGLTRISAPRNSVLLVGRVFVENDSDIAAAYNLSKELQVKPLGQHPT
jgi:hypothetical protein